MRSAFPQQQQGAAAVMFAIMLPVLMGFITLGIESARYMAYQGQLRNAAEVASLMISARGNNLSDENGTTLSNEKLAKAVVVAMVPDADDLKITVESCSPDENCHGLNGDRSFYQYRVNIESNLTQWFPDWTGDGMGFYDPEEPMTISAVTTSRKHPGSGIDVVFVADFSGSMNCEWGDTDEDCQNKEEDEESKISDLRTAINGIALKLEEYSKTQPTQNTMALVPFNFHTRNCKEDNDRDDDDLDDDCQIRQVYIKDQKIVNEQGNPVTIDYWINKMFTEKNGRDYTEQNDSNFYTVSPVTLANNLTTKMQGMKANGGTASYEGIIRAAQFLDDEARTNPYRLIIVLSDGEDFGYRKTVHEQLLQGWRLKNSYCDEIRKKLNSLKVSEIPVQSRIAVIGIDYNADDDPNLARCAGPGNVFTAENMDDVYDLLLELIGEEIGHLYFDNDF